MLTKVAKDRHLTLSVSIAPNCPWMLGLHTRADVPGCQRQQRFTYGVLLGKLRPDVVIVAHVAIDDPVDPPSVVDDDLGPLEEGTAEYKSALRTRTETAVDRLQSGRRLVIIEPIPITSNERNPLSCLSDATYVDECRFVATEGPTPFERIDRDLADGRDNVWSLDFDQAVCPYLPICDPIINGVIVRRDATHISTAFSATLAPAFERFLDDNDVLEYPELGMEAVWRIEVEDFPAFVVVDDKGNDFFAGTSAPTLQISFRS